MYLDKKTQESFQQKLDLFFELLVERGRRCHEHLSELERQELCGYLLVLSPEQDQYTHLNEGDEIHLSIPYYMSQYLIDPTQDNKDFVLAAIRLSTKNMFKDHIDKMFLDYRYEATNDQLLEISQQKHDSCGEL